MFAKQAQALLLVGVVAVVFLADGTTAKRKKRELPMIWENIKTLPKEEIVSSVKAIFNPNARNIMDEKITEEINTFLAHPDLDPMVIPHVDVDIVEGLIKLNGTLDKITATGISKLKVDKIHVNVLLLKAEFEFTLPSLSVAGKYNMDCMIDGILPLFGKGPFEVNVTDLKVAGSVKIGLKDGSVYIKSLDLDLTVGGLNVNIQRIMDDEDISKVINGMINTMALDMIADNKKAVEKIVADRLVRFVNSKMEGVSFKTVLQAIEDIEITTSTTSTSTTTTTPTPINLAETEL